MRQLLRRFLTVVLCFTMLMTCMTTATFAQTNGTQEYITKTLYALDQNALWANNETNIENVVKASANDFENVEVLGTSANIWGQADYHFYEPFKVNYLPHTKPVMYLTSYYNDRTVKNITYKITSTNPDGFKELAVSFIGRVEASKECDVTPFFAVQGSATAPSGEYESDGYFASFTDLKRVTDTTPANTTGEITVGRESDLSDYSTYGETIVLTDEVRGLTEYYINFSYLSESRLTTAVTDISFAEKVPAVTGDDYNEVVLINSDCSAVGDKGMHFNDSANCAKNVIGSMGFSEIYCDRNSATFNGHPYVPYVNADKSKTGLSYWSENGGFGQLTFKVNAPVGSKIKALKFEYTGNVEADAGAGAASQVTTMVGNSAAELAVAKRYMSYNDNQGNNVVNVGTNLEPFTVAGNDKNEMWVSILVAGAKGYLSAQQDAWIIEKAYVDSIKITAIAEEEKVDQGDEITSSAYASKSLYALDTAKYHNQYGADNLTQGVLVSADNYANVEVLGATPGMIFGGLGLGCMVSGDKFSEIPPVLTANSGLKNITYKITSTNPDGFEELDISYLAGVDGNSANSFVKVLGSSEAPVGTFESDGYFANFVPIREIIEATPGVNNTLPSKAKNYHDYGETLVLREEVAGLSEYYITFSFATEGFMQAWLTDISFAEKVKVDYSNANRYTTVTLTDMDYTSATDRGFMGDSWQNSSEHNGYNLLATTNDYCKVVNIERNLWFNGNETENWLGIIYDWQGNDTWTSGSFVVELTAPEGKIFKGLNIDLDGKNTIEACAGPDMGTSITVNVSDEFVTYNDHYGMGYRYKTGTGTVKRFYSYTDSNGVVKKSVGDLTAFNVVGNNKDKMYVEFTIGGGLLGMNYIQKMKIDGIFADKSVIDDIKFSGNGAFPTNGSLTAVYSVGAAPEGTTMPSKLTFILAAYEVLDNGGIKLLKVTTDTVENPANNTDYPVELTGLPTNNNNCIAKAFVWSDVDNSMTPISSVYQLGE